MKKFFCGLCLAGALTMVSGTFNTVEAQETRTKKGWSKKKKYTVIGTAAGAATGVAVSKNNSKGAVIGGVTGAGAGYLYGKRKDKKRANRQ